MIRESFRYIKKRIGKIVSYSVLILFLLISIMPFLWMVQAALRPDTDLRGDPFAFTKSITLSNIMEAWTRGKMGRYMLNSIIVAVPRVVGILLLATLAGYGLGKLKFKGRNFLFSFILIGMMVPIQAMIIPIYYNIQRFGLINTHLALIIPSYGLSMPFAVFMMRSFFRDVPDEIIESATIDGCGEYTTWAYIMVPLVAPAILALLVFEFMWAWNDFLLPMLMVYDDKYRTLPLGLMYFNGKYTIDHTLIASAVTIATAPIIFVYILFQRTFIKGITSGAVKG